MTPEETVDKVFKLFPVGRKFELDDITVTVSRHIPRKRATLFSLTPAMLETMYKDYEGILRRWSFYEAEFQILLNIDKQ